MDALWLSMKLAVCVAAILLAIGMPVAYWLAYSKWRGKFLLESVVALPLVLPPTVLGFYALVAMGPRGPLGKLWIALFGHGLAFTFGGLILASVLYSFPFAVQPLVSSFESVDTNCWMPRPCSVREVSGRFGVSSSHCHCRES
jgi:molybdate transport system permease protein